MILTPLTEDDFHKHDVNLYFLDITGEQKQRVLENQKLRQLIEDNIKGYNELLSTKAGRGYMDRDKAILEKLLADTIQKESK